MSFSRTPLSRTTQSRTGKTPAKTPASARKAKKQFGDIVRLEDARPDEKNRLQLSDLSLTTLGQLGPHPRLASLYLRDNHLRSFDPSAPVFPSVVVLDLSGNDLASAEGIDACPSLRELYLTGNRLTNLESLPALSSLEVLSVSHNPLVSLETSGALPSLKLLFASHCSGIENLEGIVGSFPRVEEIDLRGCPVSDHPREIFRVTAIHACGDALFRINCEDITQSELDIAYGHPVKAVECVRMGMMIPASKEDPEAVMTGQDLCDHCDEWHLEYQRRHTESLPVRVVSAGLRPADDDTIAGEKLGGGLSPVEGRPLTSVFEFDYDDGHCPAGFSYQWYVSDDEFFYRAIPGATSRDHTPTYDEFRFGLKVECTALSAEGVPIVTASCLSDNVTCGEPECTSLVIEGSPTEHVTLTATPSYVGGVPGACRFRWFRVPDASGVPELLNASDPDMFSYTLTRSDVNTRICVEFTPVRADGVTGRPVENGTALVQPVEGTIPTIRALRIRGAVREGETVTAVPGLETVQGVVGADAEQGCRFQWFRAPSASDGSNGSSVNDDDADGGDPSDAAVPIPGATSASYECTLADVGSALVVVALPYRQYDGLAGTPVRASTPGAVAPAQPRVSKLSMRVVRADGATEVDLNAADPRVTEGMTVVVDYAYTGGVEGETEITWSHVDPATGVSKTFTPVPPADGSGTHTCTSHVVAPADAGFVIRARVLPVRAVDAVKGTAATCELPVAVSAVEPHLTYICLNPNAQVEEGTPVNVEYTYAGGVEGQSTVRWYVGDRPGGMPGPACSEVTPATATSNASAVAKTAFTPSAKHVGKYIAAVVLPVREDGSQGEPSVAWSASRVSPGRPRAGTITILGAATEKHTLTAMCEYSGGNEGNSRWQWHRAPVGSGAGIRSGSTDGFTPIAGATSPRYRATRSDLGHRLMVTYTPVRDDGVEGARAHAVTEAVDTGKDGEWPLGSVELVGRCEVGSALTAVVVYDGGVEGDSVFRWHRVGPDGTNGTVIENARGSTYTPTDDDVGHYVRVDYYPVRSDGMRGDRAVAVSARTIGKATRDPPIATDVSIEDTVIAGVHSLRARYTYRCAVPEGATVFKWFVADVNGPPVPLSELGTTASPATIAVTSSLIGKRAYLEVTPVNTLGHQGTTRTATTSHTIHGRQGRSPTPSTTYGGSPVSVQQHQQQQPAFRPGPVYGSPVHQPQFVPGPGPGYGGHHPHQHPHQQMRSPYGTTATTSPYAQQPPPPPQMRSPYAQQQPFYR